MLPKRAPEHCSIRFIRERDTVISKGSVQVGGLRRVVEVFLSFAYMPNDIADLKKGVDNSASDGSRKGIITLVVGSLEKNLDVWTQRSFEDRRGLVGKSIAFLQEGAGGSEDMMAVI